MKTKLVKIDSRLTLSMLNDACLQSLSKRELLRFARDFVNFSVLTAEEMAIALGLAAAKQLLPADRSLRKARRAEFQRAELLAGLMTLNNKLYIT